MIKRSSRRANANGRPKSSLANKAYEMLSERLMDARLVPGMLLNRREIAAELDMSVAPVLEAMVQLESEGFLESVPRKGTLVRSVRLEDLRGQLILREALECEAALYYCGEPIERNESRLGEMARRIDATDDDARGDQWRADYAFHLALMECAGVAALTAAFRQVMRQKLFMAVNLYMSVHRTTKVMDSHVRLLAQLKTGKPDKAVEAIRAHLRSDKQEFYAR
jgi:DNA-binding GntR family transcriptional regulator